MDPQGLGDPPTGRPPDVHGQQKGEAPAASSAPASRAKTSPAQLQNSAGKDQKAASPRPASSTPADSTPLRTAAPPNVSSVAPVLRQPQRQHEWASQVVDKASPREHKSPERFTLDPSFGLAQLDDYKDSSCGVNALVDSGRSDEATSTTLLLDASFSASAEASTASTEVERTSRTSVEPAEPTEKRPRGEPVRKRSSAVSTRRPSRDRLPPTTREGKSGEPRVTPGIDGGEQLGASSTVKSDDEHPKTSLLHNISSRVGTLLGNIFGRSPPRLVPQPEAAGPGIGARTGGGSRKRKPHSYASRQTGDTGVVSKVRPRTKESLLQPDVHRSTYTRSTRDVAAAVAMEFVGACEERLSKSQEGVRESVAGDGEKAERELDSFKVHPAVPPESSATETSLTGVPFQDGHGDIQMQRRRRTRLPPSSIRGSKAASPHCYTVAVMTAAGESPIRSGHGEKKSKEKKLRKGHHPDDGDAKAGKSKSSSSGRGKKHGRKQGRRRDKESSPRSSRGARRKGKDSDKTEDAADILEVSKQPETGSTYDVSNDLASREFNFEIAMEPFTRGALPRSELTQPSKQRLGSDPMRKSPQSPMSPHSVEPGSPASPVSPERRASPAHGDDLNPLIKPEARAGQKGRAGKDKKPSPKEDLSPPVETCTSTSPAEESRKKPRKKTSDRKSRSERRHRSKSKQDSKRGRSGKGKRSRRGEPLEKKESSLMKTEDDEEERTREKKARASAIFEQSVQ